MNNREAIIQLHGAGVNTITIISSKLVPNKFSKILVKRVLASVLPGSTPHGFQYLVHFGENLCILPFECRSIKMFTRKRMGKNPAEYYTYRG